MVWNRARWPGCFARDVLLLGSCPGQTLPFGLLVFVSTTALSDGGVWGRANSQLNREKHSHAGWCQHVRVGQSLPSTSSGHDQDNLFKSAGKVGCVDPGTDLHRGDQLAHVLRVRSFRKEIILMVTDGNTVRD